MIVKDLLYAVVGLIAAGVAVWQIWFFVNQGVRSADADYSHLIIVVICAVVALI